MIANLAAVSQEREEALAQVSIDLPHPFHLSFAVRTHCRAFLMFLVVRTGSDCGCFFVANSRL